MIVATKTRPSVTREERRQARLQDLDRAGLERLGVSAATQIGFRAQLAAVRAFKRGQDPREPFRREWEAAAPLIATGMAAGHLAGRRRSVLAYQQAPQPLALSSTAYHGAVEALQKRLALTPEQVKELQGRYQAEALRVMQKASDAVERKLQLAMLETTEAGEHVRGGVKALQEAFAASGMTPRNSFTLEAIFRTQTQMAYAAGRWNADQDPAIQEILWGYKYVTVGDDRVRPEHVGLDGVQLPKEDGFWGSNYPPNGWACRCSAISTFEERDPQPPPDEVDVDGEMVKPGADAGFRFNPGEAFADTLPPVTEPAQEPGWVKPFKEELAKAEPVPIPIVEKDISAPKLSRTQVKAFKEYSEAIGFDINQNLREGVSLTHEEAAVAKHLSTAIEKHGVLPEPVQAYRAMSWSHKEDHDAFVQQLAEGRTLQLKGFTSTSLDREFVQREFTGRAGGSLIMEIKATKGIRMTGSLTEHEEQKELLLNHNSQFRVVGTRKEGSLTVVSLEQIK